MKSKENDFFVNTVILKYKALSKKEKSIINLCLDLFLALFIIGKLYNAGEVLGEFLYNINN
ncbi:hypothetical protein CW731_03785 [Polaribacter sp. ALD11]|uniref:hypothetical protein n=1 Tax=Polaribacter sp. ALD11 TaxID=2058137 RepID=UPI000C30E5C7|nr:hypothetical protein [Polaribacter sp. ALD11]AUC84473.1 hypothetical protein CW731_03785 [Polaribacter sp. ALD11]